MTDESHEMDPAPQPSAPAEHDPARVLEGAGVFTSGEGLVAFAGMVIVAVWIIFGLIADEYGPSWELLLAGVTVIILPRLNRANVEKVHPLPILMKVIGYAIVIVSVFNVVEDLRFGAYDDFVSVLGALVLYAAGVMAFVGARQIKI